MKLARPNHLPRFSDPAPQQAPASYAVPDIRNADAVLALDEFRAIEIGNRAYRVPPIPYDDGVALDRISIRLAKISNTTSDASLDQLDAVIADTRKIARRLLIPLGVRRRLWQLGIRPDPLKGCTDKEIGAVLSFLHRCRTNAAPRTREAAAARRLA